MQKYLVRIPVGGTYKLRFNFLFLLSGGGCNAGYLNVSTPAHHAHASQQLPRKPSSKCLFRFNDRIAL
jgi:hypothetical protein